VEAAAITARLEDGVLALTVPKAPKEEPASVSIRVD
jgi:HSP20 family molecular chaperone IbpA